MAWGSPAGPPRRGRQCRSQLSAQQSEDGSHLFHRRLLWIALVDYSYRAPQSARLRDFDHITELVRTLRPRPPGCQHVQLLYALPELIGNGRGQRVQISRGKILLDASETAKALHHDPHPRIPLTRTAPGTGLPGAAGSIYLNALRSSSTAGASTSSSLMTAPAWSAFWSLRVYSGSCIVPQHVERS